ncbi:hypothetical protein L1766_05060 [Thermovorax subterraneus]|nr:hypothetical protein [Thermovorax subterraneus]
MYRIYIKDLSPEDIESIVKEVSGQGGFQDLLRKLQKQYSVENRSIYLEHSDIERMIRYSKEYGEGGFQNRIKKLIEKIRIINNDLNELLKSYNF